MKNYYVGQKLIELRGDDSQAEIAARAGVSRSYYCNVENNRRPASEQFLQRIANYYRLTISDLITLEENTSPLSIAVENIENPHEKAVVSSIAEDWKKLFQEQCEYRHMGLHPSLVHLLKDFGYAINPERPKLDSPVHFEDERHYVFYDMPFNTCGLNIKNKKWSFYLNNNKLLQLQDEAETLLLFLLFKYSKTDEGRDANEE